MNRSRTVYIFVGFLVLAALAAVGVVLLMDRDLIDLNIPGALSKSESNVTDTEATEGLRRQVEELKTELAESRERVKELESKLAFDPATVKQPGKSGKTDMSKDEKAEWAKKKKDGKAWAGRKGKKDWKPGLPEGMTREEQDLRVREIVDRLDWPKFADAIAVWGRSDSGGRGISVEEKETLGEFFAALGQLNEVGVEFFDRRVARRFVPAMVSSLGANLDEGQSQQITGFVDEVARQEETQPEPDPPLRYAQEKALDIQNTIDLEARMQSILRPEQFQEYLAEVGDDPFRSGFGFKTQRLACAGATAEEVTNQVTDLWAGDWYGLQDHRAGIAAIAQRFVSDAVAVPPVDTALSPAARRRAVLERTLRILELQGRAEQEILATLPLTEEQRLTVIGSQWPVLDLVIEE
jgi:hypothetical protein